MLLQNWNLIGYFCRTSGWYTKEAEKRDALLDLGSAFPCPAMGNRKGVAYETWL